MLIIVKTAPTYNNRVKFIYINYKFQYFYQFNNLLLIIF